MSPSWLPYLFVLSLLAAGAALALEGALRALGRPVRWSWLGALWAPVLIPLASWLLSRIPRGVPGGASGASPEVAFVSLPAIELPARAAATPALGDALLAGSLFLSAMLLVLLAIGHGRLLAGLRRWRSERVDGTDVSVAPDFGPAVIGLLRPRIVVPAWLLERPAGEIAATLAHERAHRAAGDTRLLAAALAAVALVPWNPVAWWTLRRLRESVETDCDERVLRAGASRLDYGVALIQVARRSRRVPLLAAALAEPKSLLERRILMMHRRSPDRPLLRAGVLGTLSAALLAVAATAQQPSGADTLRARDAEVAQGSFSFRADTLRTTLPEDAVLLLDGRHVDHAAVQDLDPDEIARIEIVKGPLAGGLIEEAIGEPGRGRSLIRITSREAAMDHVEVAPTEVGGRARFTPMTVRPEMRNRREVLNAVGEHYPPVLRDAGVEGRTVIWFRISEEGEVVEARIAESSGHEAMDEAALEVARTARFRPARNGDRPVAVWVQIPISFTLRR